MSKVELVTLLALCSNIAVFAKKTPLPHIIFIMTDDMGYECIGAYGSTYHTPVLDQMAKEGVRFNYAFSQPLSTPSRVEVMTGKYNHKNYVDFGYLDQQEKTFGNLAKMAGYKTCIVGKWQLGNNASLPKHFGFDQSCLWQLRYKNSPQGERYKNALLEVDGHIVPRNKEMYGPDYQAKYIHQFISKNKNKPFFLYYPMLLVHSPFQPTPSNPSYLQQNKKKGRNSSSIHFPEMVSYCDKLIGQLIDHLKKEKIYDQTLIIFTGDNGTGREITTRMKDGRLIQGGKGLTTDAGTKVPLIVTFGKRIKEGMICDDLIDFTDILPTMAEAMNTEIPEEWNCDGTSFLPQILSKKSSPREWVFCHYDSFFAGEGKPSKNAARYIRNHRYKLYSTGSFFDISTDVLEQNNIFPNTGSNEAENARAFLQSKLDSFPKWKNGDLGRPRITLPGLDIQPIKWEDESE